MLIQLLTATNLPCLDRLTPEVFDNAIDPVQLGRFIGDPRHIMLVAFEDGLVVGMASAVEYFHPDKPPQLWINEVGVSPAYQGREIGRALTAAIVRASRQRGCVFARLATAQDNVAGQRCFGSVTDGEAPPPFLLYEWDIED